MTDSGEQATLVTNIIRSLMPVLDKKALVLFTGGTGDYAAYRSAMDELMLTPAKMAVTSSFDTLVSEADLEWIRPRLIRDVTELYEEMRQTDLIVIPVLTRNTLAKGAVGIQDNLVSIAIAKGFMTGIPILAVTENCDPESAHTKEKQMDQNPAYNRMIQGYEKKWTAFGATLIEAEEFSTKFRDALYPELKEFRKTVLQKRKPGDEKEAASDEKNICSDWCGRVLTLGDVQKLSQGQRLKISEKTVITPSAKEALDEKKIAIEIV